MPKIDVSDVSEWVEWLIGWPLGWTDSKPLATDKYQQWQQQHSAFCQESDHAVS